MESDRVLAHLVLDKEGRTIAPDLSAGSICSENDMIGMQLVMINYLVRSRPPSRRSLPALSHMP